MPPTSLPGQTVRALLSLLFIGCLIVPGMAATYVFDGSVRSQVHITQTTTIQISGLNPSSLPNGSKIVFNATYPSSSSVKGYSISPGAVQISANPAPSSISGIMTDPFGNKYKQLVWNIGKNSSPSFTITVTSGYDADITGDLSPLSYDDAIGTSAYPQYREATTMVQADAAAIVNKKNQLLSGAASEAEAVDRIINFVRASIYQQDMNMPKDAVSSLGSSKGNCVNRAHLALALLRSADIPARCVYGLVYGDDYAVTYPMSGGSETREIAWGSGSHVWIEVYYPDEGVWVAYDPFMDKGFVDSRHVKLAVCQDFDSSSLETRGEAGVLSVAGASPSTSVSTSVSSSSLKDTLALHYRYADASPDSAFMMAREMQLSTAPTVTPPTATPTALPNNTTVTPTIKANATPMPTPSLPAVDYGKHNVTGTIVDASTGAPVVSATVLLDSIEISASQTGTFTFLYAVSNGSYVLSVSAPGYMTEKQVLLPNNADMDVTVKLVPLASSATPSPTAKPSPAPGAFLALAALATGILIRRKKAP